MTIDTAAYCKKSESSPNANHVLQKSYAPFTAAKNSSTFQCHHMLLNFNSTIIRENEDLTPRNTFTRLEVLTDNTFTEVQ